jgi:16S rRNA (adenine(1408)-N(1))-methyltransferase
VVDLGTGDGRFVLHAARSDPRALVIGVDADAASMVEASRKAARGRMRNALFVVSAVESLPHELDGVADEVQIHFPWGSLLRGIVNAEEAVVGPITRLCAPGASVTAFVSIAERDRQAPAVSSDDLSRSRIGFIEHGLALVEARAATQAEIAATRSSWAKRLGAGSRRPVTLLRFSTAPAMPSSHGSC